MQKTKQCSNFKQLEMSLNHVQMFKENANSPVLQQILIKKKKKKI